MRWGSKCHMLLAVEVALLALVLLPIQGLRPEPELRPERRAPRQVLRQGPLLAETLLGLDKAMRLAEIPHMSGAIPMLQAGTCSDG